MKFFKNLSIGRKIVAILMLIVAIEVLIALCGLHFLRQMQGDLHRIVDRDAESVRLAGEMQANMLQIVRAEKNMILSATEEERTRLAESIAGLQADLREAQIRLKELSDPDEKVLLDEFDGMWSRFMEADEEIRRLSALERKDEAAGLSMGNARELRSAAGDLMQAIVKKNVKAFEEGRAQADRNTQRAVTLMIVLILASLAVALTLGLLVSRSISASLNDMVIVADAIAQGNLDVPVEAKGKDETGRLGASIRQMQSSLRKSRDDAAARDWLKTGIARLNDLMRGEQELTDLSAGIISEIVTYLGAQVGAFYLMDNTHGKPLLRLTGSYAYSKRKNLSNEFGLGEGLVGQAALEKKPIVVRNVPEDYIKVTSGLGEAVPRFVSVFPFLFDGRVKGLVEIGALDEVSDLHFEYLKQAMPAVAISIETAQKREQLSESLARAQALTEELEAQQEELKAANEELEEQTRALRESEEKLKAQQEELEATNEELEEKTEALERQKRDVERTNRELERARGEIEERAEELAIASKYKSEFLANMSHELRTPLNSLLLLSKSLADNKEGTLTGEQIESARVIYDSGNQLLSLINEILDLSKIEAGRMELHLEKVGLDALANSIQDHFAHMAKEKGLGLHISLSETAPKEIETDRKRAEQIIRNLMSNAIKFTEAGDIRVLFGGPRQGVSLSRSGLDTSNAVAVSIQDTGIGIPADKQKIIFEAFQQADGTTARRFGGTGLGLSISRELAHLLAGEIQLESETGKGSTFTLYLPIERGRLSQRSTGPALKEGSSKSAGWRSESARIEAEPTDSSRVLSPLLPLSIPDDRETLKDADKTILVIEDDARFVKLLLRQCHDRGFKCLAAATGEEGLDLAIRHVPQAIILDIRLPGMDGWAVLESLKGNPNLRHIPVHIMSVEDPSIEAFRKGAIGFLNKPASQEDLEEAFSTLESMLSRKMKNLLVVEDDEHLRKSVVNLIGNGDVQVDEAATGIQALGAMKSTRYDCIILDLGLPDMTGFELLEALEKDEALSIPPVIVHTARDLTREEEVKLRQYADSIIIKGVRSDERLLDETSLFLHRMVGRLPEKQRKMIIDLHDTDALFRARKVLIVDDDMRNVFAISKLLEEKGMKVVKAEDGKRALDALEQHPDVDLVLMDIMMPVMDGYEAMQRIRSQARFHRLPIIALTAKAMAGDRDRCIEAGANDYLAKPVDVKRLLSMLRVWLYP